MNQRQSFIAACVWISIIMIGAIGSIHYHLWIGRNALDYRNKAAYDRYETIQKYCNSIEKAFINEQLRGYGADSKDEPEPNKQSYGSCQQWRAAEAGEKSAYFAAWQGFSAFSTFIVAVMALAAAVGAAYFAAIAAKYTEDGAKAAHRSADLAAKSIVAANRAWMATKIKSTGPFVVHKTGNANMMITFQHSNVGNSPAINVHTGVEFIHDFRNVHKAVAALAEKEKIERGPDGGRIVIPGEAYDREWVVGIDRVENLPIYPIVIVCITYNTPHASTVHQSAFAYHVSRGHKPMNLGAEHYVPADEIELIPASGGFAT